VVRAHNPNQGVSAAVSDGSTSQPIGQDAGTPSLRALLFDQARAFERAGDPRKAEQIYQGLVAQCADDADALLRLGLVVHRLGRAEEALGWMARAVAATPDQPKVLGILGTALGKSGRHLAAAAAFGRCIALAPGEADPYLAVGNALQDLRFVDDAVKAYRRVVLLAPTLAEGHFQLGNALFNRHSRDAVTAYRKTILVDPQLTKAYANLGASLCRFDSTGEAIVACRRATALAPRDPRGYAKLGTALLGYGLLEHAIDAYRDAIALDPGDAEAWYNLGTTLQQAARDTAAAAAYRNALVFEPGLAKAYDNLGGCLSRMGLNEPAIQACRRAVALAPVDPQGHANLGNALQRQGILDQAILAYGNAIFLDSGYAEARYNLGTAFNKLNLVSQAARAYRDAIVLDPQLVKAYVNLGVSLCRLDRIDEAITASRRAVQLTPGDPQCRVNLGNALQRQGLFTEAIDAYRDAIRLDPSHADAHYNVGTALTELGRLKEAKPCFDLAIELAPRNARYYRTMANTRRFAVDDRHVAAMEALSRDIGSFAVDEQIELHFALGKLYEDLKEPERSFRHLLAGNGLRRKQLAYDECATLGAFARTATVFTPALIKAKRGLGAPSSVPVFILGMPRSGTSLVEQILASHPQVFGAGERVEFSRLANALPPIGDPPVAFPDGVTRLSADELRALGADYVSSLCRLAPQAARITDKMPENFRFAGLIHLALPNARIIHTRRDPVDTCLSCFSKLFNETQPHTYDLAELGRYWRGYAALMDHWRSVLPADVLLEVQYEEVVADLEGQARRMVAHCGLPWDDACLAFHQTERAVRTASASQVRQPIYKSSIGRWRPYAALLQPLIEALGIDLSTGEAIEHRA
jgi:tetratricopeptide (TPR) repeat protein